MNAKKTANFDSLLGYFINFNLSVKNCLFFYKVLLKRFDNIAITVQIANQTKIPVLTPTKE